MGPFRDLDIRVTILRGRYRTTSSNSPIIGFSCSKSPIHFQTVLTALTITDCDKLEVKLHSALALRAFLNMDIELGKELADNQANDKRGHYNLRKIHQMVASSDVSSIPVQCSHQAYVLVLTAGNLAISYDKRSDVTIPELSDITH